MPIPQSQKKYLEVKTPRTSDGKTLLYDENRQVRYKISFLPITAKAELLRNTSKLPEYLRPVITEMQGDADAQQNTVDDQKVAKAAILDEGSGAATKAIPSEGLKETRQKKSSRKKEAVKH